MRGVLVGVVLTIALLCALAFGLDAHGVLGAPVLIVAPLAEILCVAILCTPLMRSDIEHRSDAIIDQLTGMLNRKALSTRASELVEQSRLRSEPVGIIVADLDHFKSVNDNHGHAVGDAVLKDVAYLLRKQLRAFDLAYRMGGEEFVVLLPGLDLGQTLELAERLREAVSSNVVGDGLSVTMSLGAAASEPDETFDYEAVFARADAALYRAKQSGETESALLSRRWPWRSRERGAACRDSHTTRRGLGAAESNALAVEGIGSRGRRTCRAQSSTFRNTHGGLPTQPCLGALPRDYRRARRSRSATRRWRRRSPWPDLRSA
jgi:diguanylate cyclase (GGDEF)-like protein